MSRWANVKIKFRKVGSRENVPRRGKFLGQSEFIIDFNIWGKNRPYLVMSLRLATHVTWFSTAAESSRSADVQADISLQTVTKHAMKQYLKCSVDWYQPMHKHRANDEPQIGFWSTYVATDSRRALKRISWPRKLHTSKDTLHGSPTLLWQKATLVIVGWSASLFLEK